MAQTGRWAETVGTVCRRWFSGPLLAGLCLGAPGLSAAETPPAPPLNVAQALRQPDAWLLSDAGQAALASVLTNQSPAGIWPKNVNTAAGPLPGNRDGAQGTFDNGATVGELRLLARVFNVTDVAAYRDGFLRGLDAVLKAQYPTGGWPQVFPPPERSYHRHITYNDGAMVRILELLREVGRENAYGFVPSETRSKAQSAFDRGVTCVVKSQIRVNDRLTVWCAQHDEVTLEPRPARSYELVSLSGAESAGILTFLMNLESPSPEVVRAVHAGARWFAGAALRGVRQTRVNGDKVLVPDPEAPLLWARFYEIGTDKPIYSGRDGVKKYALAEIEAERRNGYAWLGDWGVAVARRHEIWQTRFPEHLSSKQ